MELFNVFQIWVYELTTSVPSVWLSDDTNQIGDWTATRSKACVSESLSIAFLGPEFVFARFSGSDLLVLAPWGAHKNEFWGSQIVLCFPSSIRVVRTVEHSTMTAHNRKSFALLYSYSSLNWLLQFIRTMANAFSKSTATRESKLLLLGCLVAGAVLLKVHCSICSGVFFALSWISYDIHLFERYNCKCK